MRQENSHRSVKNLNPNFKKRQMNIYCLYNFGSSPKLIQLMFQSNKGEEEKSMTSLNVAFRYEKH